MKISVVGLGKLGYPLAVVAAHGGLDVTGIDIETSTVLSRDRGSPTVEPEVDRLRSEMTGSLMFTRSYSGVAGSEIVCLVVPTPSNPNGSFNVEHLYDAIEGIAPHLDGEYPVVSIVSTVSPGATTAGIAPFLELNTGRKIGTDVGLVYSPEFIALGEVVEGLTSPDFVLIGARDSRSVSGYIRLCSVLSGDRPVLVGSFVEAEIAKLAVNVYVTMKISYANMLGALSERFDAHPGVVASIVGRDSRIGAKYLRAGGPYGGPCFPRDGAAFEEAALRARVEVPLVEATRAINRTVVSNAAIEAEAVWHHFQDKVIAVLGLGYKVGTPVTEESFGIGLIRILAERGVPYISHDPLAIDASDVADPQQAIDRACVVVICQPWPQFKDLDYRDCTVIDPWYLVARFLE